MSKKIFCIFQFLVLTYTTILTQPNGTIRGLVADSVNGESLAFANVYIESLNRGATTDTKGYFIITRLPGGNYFEVQISYLGYKSKTVRVLVQSNRVTDFNVFLSPTSVSIGTVEKIGEKVIEPNATDIGLNRIPIQAVERHPHGVETDIFRSLQYLPGVQVVGDVSARYYVRGGESNQNLVLLDNVVVYNPFHALGLFSAIDPEMINSMEFYKAGFPSENGGRLSSVLKINSKEGNRFDYSGKASLSLLTYKGLIEGPIPNGSFIISGRKSHSRDILKKFLNNKDAPFSFYDFSYKINYQNTDPEFFDNSKFTLHGFMSKDDLVSSDKYTADYKWKNNIIGVKRFLMSDSPLYSEVGVSVSEFEAEIIPKFSNERAVKNNVRDASIRIDYVYIFDTQDELAAGVKFQTVKTKLSWMNRNGIFTDVTGFGANVSAYAKYKLLRWEQLGIDAGLRINLITLNKQGNFSSEPRINYTYRILPEFAIKGSIGYYQQNITTVSDENDVISLFEPWFITPDYLPSAKSIHYNLGFEFNIGSWFKFTTEAYYKDMRDLPAANIDKRYEDEDDFIAASGKSYGSETMLELTQNPFHFTTSYSVSWAYQKINGFEFFPKYDSRHNVKSLLEISFGSGWQGAVTWNFNTGHPFTPTEGFYDRIYLEELNNREFLESYYPQTLLGKKNSFRLPVYHRLDLTVSKRFDFDLLKFTLDLSVLNVYDRKNLFYFERDTGKKVNMLPFLTSATVKIEI
ncbi:MAG: TonB-dependent receptor [Melioribacteraceae bacterium]|nr:TonB-dependent receptor [Melioribacteraceae bacterium]